MTDVAVAESGVAELFGRINDVDTHEMVPAQLWEREFDSRVARVGALFAAQPPEVLGPNTFNIPIDQDTAPLDASTIWTQKGGGAPGALDMHRRLDVMDAMGIDKSLIFPTGPGLVGFVMANSPRGFLASIFGIVEDFDANEEGRQMCAAHNDWCIRTAQISPRLRPVAIIAMDDVGRAMAETERVIDGGVKAILIASGAPPAGMSPSHPDWDPFWALLERTNTAALLHVGGEFGFLKSTVWPQAPAFDTSKASVELLLDPLSLSTMYFAAQHYVSGMILGGVFERFPGLRVGIIELCSHWVGSWAENMDTWASQFKRRLASVLSMPPSKYVERNIRVSSFHFEPVDEYIDRYGLEDVYVYSTDYPHFESGPTDSRYTFGNRLQRHGQTTVEKFFVTNAELLMP